MKKALLILSLLMAALLVVPQAHAAEIKSGNTYSLGKDEAVYDDLYVGAQDITISGTVNGGANLAARTIIISGEIKGDLQAAAETIRITGQIDGNARLIASNIVISGNVKRDTFVAAAQFTVDSEAELNRSLFAYAGETHIDGKVMGNLHTGSGTVVINGAVTGNAQVMASQISFGEKGSVNGNLNYTAPQKLSPQDQQKVTGTIDYHETTKNRWNTHREKTFATLVVAQVFARIYAIFALGVIALLALWLMPALAQNVKRQSAVKMTKNLMNGILVFVIAPFVILALLFTVIGIPLALLLGLVYGIAWAVSVLPVAYWVGEKLLTKPQSNKYVVCIVGLIVTEVAIGILKLIPFIGPLAVFVVSVWGFGVILTALWHMVRSKETPKVVETVK